MTVYVELTTELFADNIKKNLKDGSRARRAGLDSARRPLRGLEIKDDTYGVMRVIQADGTPVPVITSSAEGGTDADNTNFIIQQITEARMEKSQIVETFGESYIFFFGEQPRFLDVTCILLNSLDFNWEAEFWDNYERFYRGSKLTELGARLYLFYDDNVVEGYMLQAQAVKVANEPLWVQMSFRLFVTNYTNVSFVGSDAFPIRGSAVLPPNLDLTSEGAFDTLLFNQQATSLIRQMNEINAQAAIQQQAISKFGGGRLLSQALRQGLNPGIGPQLGVGAGFSVSAGFSANVVAGGVLGAGAPTRGAQRSADVDPGWRRDAPLRGRIVDNEDEWTGQPSMGEDLRAEAEDRAGLINVADLPDRAILMLGAYGANINTPQALHKMGMGPTFGVAGVGIGAGAGFSAGASFGVSVGASYGGGGGLGGGGVGYGAAAGVGAGIGPGGPFAGSFATSGPTAPIAGAGVSYPGYPGYGSGYGSGLPGVSSGGYSTGGYSPGGLGVGISSGVPAGASFGGGMGSGAAVAVGGPVTAFSSTAVPGTLVVAGTAFLGRDGEVHTDSFVQTF
jgi:hypothetical protein